DESICTICLLHSAGCVTLRALRYRNSFVWSTSFPVEETMTFRRNRHLLCAGASFGVALLMYLSTAAAADLVVDPSFELGTASGPENTGGWNFANGAALSATAANAHTGSHSVNLTNGGGGASANVPLAFETFNTGVTAGVKYTLSAFGITTGPLA